MIELGKKYQTRDGRAVRILCVDGDGEQPVVGIMFLANGSHIIGEWTLDGIYFIHPANESDRQLMARHDLIPVPTKHEGWMPVSYDKHAGYWLNGRVYDSPQEVGKPFGTFVAHVTWED